MVDNPSGEPPVSPSPEPKAASPIVTFLSSSTGKLIVGGIILFAVLVAVGALAFFFLLSPSQETTIPPAPTGGSAPATETAVPTSPPEQMLDETFTFRNVFAPTVTPPKAPKEASSSSGSSSAASETANVPADTLVLTSISTENGEPRATFIWNGTEYVVGEGDQVGDSPWEVVTINSDSVVMLYGDSQVTLTVGQGYGKSGVVYDK
jgi:cytoskeletal protein RodZ